jgi:hypothetical protein
MPGTGSSIQSSTLEGEMAKKSTVTMYRSAKTGKAVSKAYAKSHPATTEKETYKKTAKKKK